MWTLLAAVAGGFFIGGIVCGAVAFVVGYHAAVKMLSKVGAAALASTGAAQAISQSKISNSTERMKVC